MPPDFLILDGTQEDQTACDSEPLPSTNLDSIDRLPNDNQPLRNVVCDTPAEQAELPVQEPHSTPPEVSANDENNGSDWRRVRAYGGIVGISILSLATSQCALVEFVYAASAANYVSFIDDHGLEYIDETGASSLVKAHLVDSPSSRLSYQAHQALERGQTRAFMLKRFPKEAIWFTLNVLGIAHINAVKLIDDQTTLLIEFISLFYADRAMKQIRAGCLGFHRADETNSSFTTDGSQIPICSLADISAIPYQSPDLDLKRWNVSPYNTFWPAERCSMMEAEGLEPRKVEVVPIPSWEETYALSHDIDIDEVADHIEDSIKYAGTVYRIIGSKDSTIYSRGHSGFGLTMKDHQKLHMAANLHEAEYTEEFDEFFSSNNMINTRKYEAYGMLAEHRRRHARELGLDASTVQELVDCTRCGYMSQSSIPDFIKIWLSRRIPIIEMSSVRYG